MIDFSDREEVKRWLDAIEPAQRRREVALALAARAALRVAPLLGGILTRGGEKRDEALSTSVAPALRAMELPWVAARYPSRANSLRNFAAGASLSDTGLGVIAAFFPFDSATVTANASVVTDAAKAVDAAEAAAFSAAVSSADAAADYAALAVAMSATPTGAAADAVLIDSGRSGPELAGMPLWPRDAPDWASKAWRMMKPALLAADQGWEVWTEWYDARLAGNAAHPPIEALEVARATIPDEIWKQGPAAVNAEIKRLIDKFRPPKDRPAQTLGDGAVDFSDRDEVQRWLDGIEPAKRRREAAVALEARAALRLLPLLGHELRRGGRNRNEVLSVFVLPCLRATALPWAAANYPSHGAELRAAAANAADTAAAVPSVDTPDTNAAAQAAADAAFVTANVAADVAAYISYAAAVSVADANAAVAADAALIGSGRSGAELASLPLWPNGAPDWASEDWRNLKSALLAADQGWEVWTDWHEARLAGDAARPPNEALELARATIPDEIWRRGPAVVNAEIKRLIDLHTPTPAPPTPATEPGPNLEVGAKGLVLTAPIPLGEFDPTVQSALQDRLKRLCPNLLDATRRVGNTHPGLMAVVSEYADLVAQPLANLDVTSLWAVGTGLLANREAFTRLPQVGGMTEPLEADHLALLQQVAAIHGAFILGFARGRELTDRADHSRLTPEILAAILPAARELLERWRHAKTMVEERTRKFFDAIENATIGPSWQTARAGYSVYVVTRNSLIAVGKLLVRANSLLATVVGGAVVAEIDPNLAEQVRLWVAFTLEQSQTILSFSESFPELNAWWAAIIDALKRDKDFHDK